MRVSILKDDNKVNVDGVGHTVPCGDLPEDFHALQWNGMAGEIEYRMTVCEHCNTRSKKPNAVIFDLAPYQKYVDAWRVEDARVRAEVAANAAG